MRSLSDWSFVVLLAVIGFAVATPGASIEGTHGVIYLVLGALVVVLPPRHLYPRWLLWFGLTIVVFASLHLLPRSLGASGAWRDAAEATGLSTGGKITAMPHHSVWRIGGLAAFCIVSLSVLGRRVRPNRHLLLASGFTLLVGIYAAFSMLAQDFGWRLEWDIEPSFGLFPNRNHSATLLAMGGICGLGALYQLFSKKRWIIAVLVGCSIGLIVWATFGYNRSRAGVLLVSIFGGLWLIGLGRRYWSSRMLVSTGVLLGLAAFIFFTSPSDVKERLSETLGSLQSEMTMPGGQSIQTDPQLDLRLLIYRDTAQMLTSEPWTGVGLGGFRYVFPQYRNYSASNAFCIHPESDWLWVLAEAGFLTALSIATFVVCLFIYAFKSKKRSPQWPLHLSCLLAAAIVPFHGLFDVPGHRVGLAFATIFLISITLRPSSKTKTDRSSSMWHAWAFRAGGIGIVLGAIRLLHAGWLDGEPTAITAAERAAEEVRKLYAEDQAALEAGEDVGEDKLKQAIKIAEEASIKAPLDPELHYLRGAMAINFDDKDSIVDASFARHRLLAPIATEVPLRQSWPWSSIDPSRTFSLWNDALNRANFLATSSSSFESHPGHVWSRILIQAKDSKLLMRTALPLTAERTGFLAEWTKLASPNLLATVMMDEMVKGSAWTDADRLEVWKQWHSVDHDAATVFADRHPELELQPH